MKKRVEKLLVLGILTLSIAAMGTVGYALEGQMETAAVEAQSAKSQAEAPAEGLAEVPTEAPAQAPTEAPAEAPAESPSETPSEAPTESPSETPNETPAEDSSETQTEGSGETPTESLTEAPTENQTESTTEAPTEAQTEEMTETPDGTPAAEPSTEPATEEDASEKEEKKKEKQKKKEEEAKKKEEEAKRLYQETIGESIIDFNAYPVGNITENTNKIYDFLRKEMGLNHAAACGVLANMQCESNFATTAVGDGGTSYGLCQWHLGRFSQLVAWCNANGYNYHLLDGQVGYMQHELLNGYYGVYSYLLNVPDTAQGAYDAAYYWCSNYEIPSHTVENSKLRGNLAMNEFYPRTLGSTESTSGEDTLSAQMDEETVLEDASATKQCFIQSEGTKLWEKAPKTLLTKDKLGVEREKLFSLD